MSLKREQSVYFLLFWYLESSITWILCIPLLHRWYMDNVKDLCWTSSKMSVVLLSFKCIFTVFSHCPHFSVSWNVTTGHNLQRRNSTSFESCVISPLYQTLFVTCGKCYLLLIKQNRSPTPVSTSRRYMTDCVPSQLFLRSSKRLQPSDYLKSSTYLSSKLCYFPLVQ